MKPAPTSCVLILIAAVAAVGVQTLNLSQRPMHVDEAVHADKFRDLLENGQYVYNPHEYHGPTLNYATLVPALLSGAGTYVQVTETTLRIVPVIFGGFLILLLVGLRDGLGRWGAVFAAGFTAISLIISFYSRYYIMEVLLVCFTLGLIVCGWRYAVRPRTIWAGGAGLFLGLMHATKETFVIPVAAMVIAAFLCRWSRFGISPDRPSVAWWKRAFHLLLGILAAAGVSVLFFSSFGRNPQGIADSVQTYAAYFQRAGQNPVHLHPWYAYLSWLCWYQFADGPVFSEGIILTLAAVACLWVGLQKRPPREGDYRFQRFLVYYTLISTVLYSLIPYKTPWCAMGFFHGMILLAGVATSRLVLSPNRMLGSAAALVIGVGAAHLVWLNYLGNFRYFCDSRNPWVYAHTGQDIFDIERTVREVAAVHPDGTRMHLQVICPGYDYWPLPWYLRDFPRVGYWSMVQNEVISAELILAMPAVEEALMTRLFELPPPGQRHMYMPLFDRYMELRPSAEIRGYIRKDLWDRFEARKEPAPLEPKSD
jgi:uncharacterized protein (TIGR03663 family)